MSDGAQLAQGLAQLRLELSPATRQKLLDYIALIQKWNKIYNLTAVRDVRQMVGHHLLDCLAVVPHVQARTILDVGSGAGLPGVPLALALPGTSFTLLDSSHKKCSFLRQAVIELALGNVEVVCARLEHWQPPHAFEMVISRAFSDLPHFVAAAGRLCTPAGVLAAMKGVYPAEELAQLPAGYTVQNVHALAVPGLAGERHLVLVKRG